MKNKIFFFCAIILTCIFYGFSAKRFESRSVNNVNILFTDKSDPIISEQNVDKLLIQSRDSAEMLFLENLDLNKSELRLVQNEMIRSAEVSVTLDGQVQAIVEARRPIARIMGSPDKYLDDDNLLMPLSKEYTVRVPLVFGFQEQDQDDLYQLIMTLRNDELLSESFSDVRIDAARGFVLSPRAFDFEVVLGSVEELDTKLVKFEAFIAKMAKDKKLKELGTVDLRYKKQVVATKK